MCPAGEAEEAQVSLRFLGFQCDCVYMYLHMCTADNKSRPPAVFAEMGGKQKYGALLPQLRDYHFT